MCWRIGVLELKGVGMARITEYTRRDRRNALIMALRGKGWSLRRIGRHPEVNLSVAAVHLVLNPADDDDDLAADDVPDDLRRLESLAADDGDVLNVLHLHRLRYAFPPDDPRAAVAVALGRRDGPPPTWAEAGRGVGCGCAAVTSRGGQLRLHVLRARLLERLMRSAFTACSQAEGAGDCLTGPT